jgi:putative glycosyltransferase
MELSIVTTLYRSAPYVAEFCRRVAEAAGAITDRYEVVLVNDGSPDDSLVAALQAFHADPRIRVIDLARNFGQHKAIMTGLAHTTGRLVFVLDSDLEEAPELLLDFHAEMRRTGADVVYGVQPRRKGSLWERASGSLFYRLFNWAAAETIPPNVLCARLMTRPYVAALLGHREREVFLQGLWVATGFTQVGVVANKRSKGTTSYTLAQKLAILVNAVTSFSNRPLVYVFYLGAIILALSIVAVVDLVVRRLFFGTLLTGWPSLMVSVWLLGGLTIFSIGIIGIYLAKVFTEVKQRPYTVVRQIYSHDPEEVHELHASQGAGEPLLYE